MQEPTDAELHQRIIEADEEAMTTWHDRTVGGVKKMLVRKGLSPEDAAEVWNDACFETIGKAGKLMPLGESLRRYVYTVATNMMAKVWEQRRRSSAIAEAVGRDVVGQLPRGAPNEAAISTESKPPSALVLRLRDCLERAPAKDRLVAKLHMENATGLEIARVLNVNIDNAYQIKGRTVARLRRCIEGATQWT